jgi:hypothetical protein
VSNPFCMGVGAHHSVRQSTQHARLHGAFGPSPRPVISPQVRTPLRD